MKLEKLGPVGPEESCSAGAVLALNVADVLSILQTKRRRNGEVTAKSSNQFDSSSTSRICFLCFGCRFRLSGITRVTVGAIPELRAARRASLPLSKTFFRFRFIPALFRNAFPIAKS
jgi:hypothetical protein